MAGESTCCPSAEWVPVADLGHALTFDCAIVRCSACGKAWAHLWTPFAPKDASYSALEEATAQELVRMPAGPERRRRLTEVLDL